MQPNTAYPYRPGFQGPDTSRQAADDIAPIQGTIKEQVLAALKVQPMASFELADCLNRSYRSVQPRTSELAAEREIYDSGLRRVDPDTGKEVTVWAILPY